METMLHSNYICLYIVRLFFIKIQYKCVTMFKDHTRLIYKLKLNYNVHTQVTGCQNSLLYKNPNQVYVKFHYICSDLSLGRQLVRSILIHFTTMLMPHRAAYRPTIFKKVLKLEP